MTALLLLLFFLPQRPSLGPLPLPTVCRRVAWLNLYTGEKGHTYCLPDSNLRRVLQITRKLRTSVFWLETVDCRNVSGSNACRTWEGLLILNTGEPPAR